MIPYLSLIFLNVSTYSKLKTIQKEELTGCLPSRALHQRKKELQLSQISLIIVAVFICCHSFKWIPNIYELRQSGKPEQDYDWPALIREYSESSHPLNLPLEMMSNLSNFLITLSCSLNVLIYLIKHRTIVLSLVYPPDNQPLPVYAVTRRRSSWLLQRMTSRLRMFPNSPQLEDYL